MVPDRQRHRNSVTATVVLQLVQEGRLSLDDTVERSAARRRPGWRSGQRAPAVGHRSGLYDFFDDPRHMEPYLDGDFAFAWTPNELLGLATSHERVFAPGERYGYSNTNTIVAGLIVEAVTGHDLGADSRTRLFAPLHLRRTTFAIGQGIARLFAHGYLVTDAGVQDVTRVRPTHTWASGNIVSTAPDVARFLHALNSGRLLSRRCWRRGAPSCRRGTARAWAWA